MTGTRQEGHNDSEGHEDDNNSNRMNTHRRSTTTMRTRGQRWGYPGNKPRGGGRTMGTMGTTTGTRAGHNKEGGNNNNNNAGMRE